MQRKNLIKKSSKNNSFEKYRGMCLKKGTHLGFKDVAKLDLHENCWRCVRKLRSECMSSLIVVTNA